MIESLSLNDIEGLRFIGVVIVTRLPGCAAKTLPGNVNEGFAATDIPSCNRKWIMRPGPGRGAEARVGTEIGRAVARYQLVSQSISVAK